MFLKVKRTLLFLFVISSCTPAGKVAGVYEIEKNDIVSGHLYLNEDGTFAEFLSARHCGSAWLFGTYGKKRNFLNLNLLSDKIQHLNKSDTVIANTNLTNGDIGIFIIENEQYVVDSTPVFAENNKYLGTTNDKGFLRIEKLKDIDSLIIKRQIGTTHRIKLDKTKNFNQLFILVYDYLFEPCIKYSFIPKLYIDNANLFYYQDWNRDNNPERIYLRKIK